MSEKTYDPKLIEDSIYKKWEAGDYFRAKGEAHRQAYVIMMPPPNVTGSLHMGHALNCTLQDILIRYYRMQGKDCLWLPGTDHAGIATQSVVERQMDEEGINRRDLGREKFLERVWRWKEKSGDIIVNQQKRLGVSADWSRHRFTMDDGLNRAVREVFVKLYNEGLIYRDRRLVNWDCKLLTAVSDLEVDVRLKKGHFWHVKYPIVGETSKYIIVATTRPETLFGDSAVAVHPTDERYRHLIGLKVIIPFTNREIPIIEDEHCDPEKGTGAVKISPAHDFDDFEVGKRHNLPMINSMDIHGNLNEQAPPDFQNLERFEARKKVLSMLEAQDLLDKVEEKEIAIPYGDRSGVVLEPRLTDQWFVNAEVLSKPALKAVEEGRTRFAPDHWKLTYYEWLKNIQPWCISRQLWWGHRIPAWHGPDQKIFVALDEVQAHSAATEFYGHSVELIQDPDVLDTWFSSALWPFSTLGWPDDTDDLKRYYPGDVLITGFDIIFFWVARMMMMGLHFMKEVPFKTVYINALVRDEKGQKMSKSKGNIIDPLDLMDQYGADALRFCMTALAAPGVDVKFSNAQIEGYRNFCTKLWNAARFCKKNQCSFDPQFDVYAARNILNQWIIDRVIERSEAISHHLTHNRFDLAASALYQFAWAEFCDWYIEFSKPLLNNPEWAEETRKTTAWVLAQLLHLLHPFIPFITEEIWNALLDQPAMLITGKWPQFKEVPPSYKVSSKEVNWLIKLISQIRALRSDINIPASAKIKLGVKGATPITDARLKSHEGVLRRLARLELIETDVEDKEDYSKECASLVHEEATYLIPVGKVIDITVETQRLRKNIDEAEKEILSLSKKLNNPQFIEKAAREIIETTKERLEKSTQLRNSLVELIAKLRA